MWSKIIKWNGAKSYHYSAKKKLKIYLFPNQNSKNIIIKIMKWNNAKSYDYSAPQKYNYFEIQTLKTW